MTPCEEAQRFLALRQPASAIACLERAATEGDAACSLELGLLLVAGKHVARDLPRALACLQQAARLGNRVAQNICIQFTALGVGGDADWTKALAELRALATSDDTAAVQVALLDRMELTPDGAPSGAIAGHRLSSEPHVWSFDRLFTQIEAAYLISRAQPLLQPSLVVNPATGALTANPVRTSHAMSFPWILEDLVIQALNR